MRFKLFYHLLTPQKHHCPDKIFDKTSIRNKGSVLAHGLEGEQFNVLENNQEAEAYECSCSAGCICPGSVNLGPYSSVVPSTFKAGLSSVKPL